MTYRIVHEAEYDSVALIHSGDVDAAEIRESRIALAEAARAHGCRGAMIDILQSRITADPPDVVDNVHALMASLAEGTRLAFVSRETDQLGVALVVESVVADTGVAVRRFEHPDPAWGWLAYGDAYPAAGMS